MSDLKAKVHKQCEAVPNADSCATADAKAGATAGERKKEWAIMDRVSPAAVKDFHTIVRLLLQAL